MRDKFKVVFDLLYCLKFAKSNFPRVTSQTVLSLGTRLEHAQPHDYARIDMESLPVLELVMPAPAVEPQPPPQPMRLPPDFWECYGDALGVDLEDLDDHQGETLVLNVAALLKQSIDGLQQRLRTRSELKNEPKPWN